MHIETQLIPANFRLYNTKSLFHKVKQDYTFGDLEFDVMTELRITLVP